MRVTRESLLRLAHQIAQERAYTQSDIVAIYLIGSLRHADPFLGGSTDVDLVIVHETRPGIGREFAPLPAAVHLDILHRGQQDYPSPRQMRLHPLLGHELYDALLLYERRPFFEFLQAGVRAGSEFTAPMTICQRSFQLLAESRRGWFQLSQSASWGVRESDLWLEILAKTAGSLMELDGAPLTERRFLHDFSTRLANRGMQELFPAFLELLGNFSEVLEETSRWLSFWESDFQAAAQTGRRSEIHPARLVYYQQGIRHYLEGERPIFALWPLMRTWTWAALALPEDQRGHWVEWMRRLGWNDQRQSLLDALDRYLDRVQEVLEAYATEHGVNLDTLPSLL